jgi:hypothetical protein
MGETHVLNAVGNLWMLPFCSRENESLALSGSISLHVLKHLFFGIALLQPIEFSQEWFSAVEVPVAHGEYDEDGPDDHLQPLISGTTGSDPGCHTRDRSAQWNGEPPVRMERKEGVCY